MKIETILINRLTFTSLLKLNFIGIGIVIAPFFIVVGIIDLFLPYSFKFISAETGFTIKATGFVGFLLSIIEIPIFSAIFSILISSIVFAGTYTFSRFRDINISYKIK